MISGTTLTTSLKITVSPTMPYKSSHTKSITLDASWPTASITSTNNVETSQTATLTCIDTEGMSSYYWGTSSSPPASTGYTNRGAWYTSTEYSTSEGNYGAKYAPTS